MSYQRADGASWTGRGVLAALSSTASTVRRISCLTVRRIVCYAGLMTNHPTTTNAVTTRVGAVEGLTLGAFVEAVATDEDLREAAPAFMGLNDGIIKFTTVGPEAGLDGVAYAVMLQAFGLARPDGTIVQEDGCGIMAALMEG